MSERESSKSFIYAIGLFAVSFFIIIIVLGVPLQLLFGGLNTFDASKQYLRVDVAPETPTSIGQEIVISVTNQLNGAPVSDAELSIINNGATVLEAQTDSSGKYVTQYLGEVTIIKAKKEGYNDNVAVLPKNVPDKWVRETAIAAGISVVPAFITYFLTKKKKRVRRKKSLT